MPDARRVTNAEKRLGFRWPRGISRAQGESCKIRVIRSLIDGIDELKYKWFDLLPRELRRRPQFEEDCLDLYALHAHRIWPDPPADRRAWLVQASRNSWDGLYPRDLYIGEHDSM